MGKRAFILNDYTVDLISEDGALFCGPGAQAIAPAICTYLDEFAAGGDYIAVCLDTHTSGDTCHPETKLFPPHNVKGSPGHALYGLVAAKVAELAAQYPEQLVVIEKHRYSPFVGTALDLWLRCRDVDQLTVSGVCTDMCVLHTVIDAYGRGYQLTVPRAVCHTPNAPGGDFAFAHFQSALGVNVI